MTHQMKKICAVLLAILLAATLLAACGKTGDTKESDEKTLKEFTLGDETYAVEKWVRCPDYDTDAKIGYGLCVLKKTADAPIILSGGVTKSQIDVTLDADGSTVESKNISFLATDEVEGYKARVTFEFALDAGAALPTSGVMTYGEGDNAETQTLDLSGLAAPEEPVEEATTEAAPVSTNEPVTWLGCTLEWQIINDDAGVTDEQRSTRDRNLSNQEKIDGERYLYVTFTPREGAMKTTEINEQFGQLCMADGSGNTYQPLSFIMTGVTFNDETGFSVAEEQDFFSLLYSVPEAAQDADFTPVIDETAAGADTADAAVPAELVGRWTGSVKPANGSKIDLQAEIKADGTGDYTFNQGGYEESYPFTLESEGNSFAVTVPENNTLGISVINGTYEYENGVLTLHISTQFRSGGTFQYDIDCVKE